MFKLIRQGATPVLLVLALLTACAGESADELMRSAKDYLAKNDNKAAIIQLKSALQKDVNKAEARFLLGKALLEGGDAVAGSVELRKALDLQVAESQVLPLLARAMIIEGQAKRLTDEYGKTTLADAAAEADLKTSIATAYGIQGETAKAAQVLAAALQAGPDHAPALLFQARLKADAKEFDSAFALIDRVLTKNPKDHEAWHLKGELLAFAKQDNKAAMEAFGKALAAKSNYVPSASRLIAMLLAADQVAEAKKHLDALRKLLPGNPQTLYLEALTLVAERDFKGAREKALLLLRAAPDNINVLQLAGSIEMQLNSLLQAETYLNKVLSMAPGQVVTRRQLAQIALRSGQPAKVLELLQPLLDKPGTEAADYGLAAEALLLAGDEKKATEYFALTAKLDPKDVKSRTALALSRLQSGNAAQAMTDLQAIAAADSGTFADMALISAQLRRKELDNAFKSLDALEKKQPDRPLASMLRARIHLARNDPAAARASFESALKIDAQHFPAIAGLATIDLADGKPELARKRFEDFLKTEPKNTQALLALASLRARSGASKEEVTALFNDAVKANPGEAAPRRLLIDNHLSNKDFKVALSAAQDAAAALPNNTDLLDALGRAQALAGETNQAISSFSKLAAQQPQSPQPQLRLAEVYLGAKNNDAAAASLKRALAITPNLLAAQRALIEIELVAKRHPEAIDIARTVQKQRPIEPAGYLLEGDIELTRKNWIGAEAAFRNGLKAKQSATTEMAARLHSTLVAAGKTAEAERHSAAWMKEYPSDDRYVRYLGDTALRQRNFGEAESRYRAALKIDPVDALTMNNLAWLLVEQKKPGGLPLAQKAAELLPNSAPVLDTLAMALAAEGQMPKALETMKKAVSLAPEARGLQLNLAQLYIRAGDKAAARTELEALAKLGDKFGGQQAVADLLKSL